MKVVIVSGLLPSGHYTENLANGLSGQKDIELIIYTDKKKDNLLVKNCGLVKLVWSRSPAFIFQIIYELLKDKPDIVHFQHEINMFGGLVTALVFPFLLLFSKISGAKVITTVHATVKPSQIDEQFVKTFNKNPKLIKPGMLKLFFRFLYTTICLFSDLCVVHTETAKEVLSKYSPRHEQKLFIIPTAIPQIKNQFLKKKSYFFYFGYIARRKGLENLVAGFKKYCQKNPKSNFKLLLAGGVIAGQESSLTELKKIISLPNLKDKIKYLGFLERRTQEKLYAEAYGVVIPAKLSISASGPLYHAFSHGKFIIASRVGHLKDEVVSGFNGYLISNGKWEAAFSKAIKNPTWVKKIEKGSRETAQKRTPLKTAKIYVKTYNSLILKNV